MATGTLSYALPPGTEVGKYVIHRALGAGGFGVTYEAEDPKDGRLWAIKEFYPRQFCTRDNLTVAIHTDLSDESYDFALKKFRQEAELLSTFDHPGIVKVRESLDAYNTAYFVMDFIEGLSFENWLGKRSKRPTEKALRGIFENILDAVGYLHERGFMHRDLSPDNIMIRPGGDPVLIDFGTMGQGLNRRMSTIQFRRDDYSPPEQGDDDEDQGAYTDIFALGGVFYRAVTGEPPVRPQRRINRVANGKPDPYVPVAEAIGDTGGYSQAFLDGIDRALQLNTVERPNSINIWLSQLGWSDEQQTIRVKGGKAARTVETVVDHKGGGKTTIDDSRHGVAGGGPRPPDKKWKLAAAAAGLLAIGGVAWAMFNPGGPMQEISVSTGDGTTNTGSRDTSSDTGSGETSRARDVEYGRLQQQLKEEKRARIAAEEAAKKAERDRLARLEDERRRQQDEDRRRRDEEQRKKDNKLRVAVYWGIDFDGRGYPGTDLKPFEWASGWQDCANRCSKKNRCTHFTFNTKPASNDANCFLKTGQGGTKPFDNAISGVLFRGNRSKAPHLYGQYSNRTPKVYP